MADVVISYAVENEATARQLAEAIGRLGYNVWRPDDGSNAATADTVTDQIAEAGAVVVIWSSAAASSDWVRAEANIARGMRKLVQASADGNPPPIPFDAAQVSSISTWLGDDLHPGWEAVKTALATVAGPPPAPPAPPSEPAPPTVVPVPPPAPEPDSLSDPEPNPAAAAPASPPPPVAAPTRGPSGVLIVIVLLVFVALLAAGAWFWRRSQTGPVVAEANFVAPAPAPEDAPPAQPALEIPPATPSETFDRQAVLRTSGPAVIRSAPSAAGFTLGRIEPGESFATYRQDGDWWRVRTAAGVTGYVMASAIGMREPDAQAPARPAQAIEPDQSSRTERQPRQPRGPRIRKENSEVMAAFCDGAGRGTAQCRRFQRSTY
jgi:hypothetical protein